MQACEQTKGQSIYDHGINVWQHLEKLLDGNTDGFRLPQWYSEYYEQLIATAHDPMILRKYAIYHDAGKPYCLTIDEDGRRHFPNHAEISRQTWIETFGDCGDNAIIADLISLDMIMHTEKFEQIIGRNLPNATIASLLLSALAELHSNARMFGGGIESDSFKIKWKRLDKLGAKLCKRMFEHEYMYVITRRDLSAPQRAVQAGHAAIEAARAYLKPDDEHPSLIICWERNESKLEKLRDKFKNDGIEFKEFYEPDRGNELTALACKPASGKAREAFKKLQLIRE